MTTTETNEVATIVQRVQCWPAPMRIALARRILETLERLPEGAEPPRLPRGPSAAEVAAMFKTDRPAPDDVTVKQWIDEYRMGRFGK